MGSGNFTDKSRKPDDDALSAVLKKSFKWWTEIKGYVLSKHKTSFEEWNYSKSFGWSARIKDQKRVIVYLMPLKDHFKASFVLGGKASDEALSGNLTSDIKEIIKSSKVYAEGRGFRIDVTNYSTVKEVKKIIDIKLSNLS